MFRSKTSKKRSRTISNSKKRSRTRFAPRAERLEDRRLLAVTISEEFRPFEFGFAGNFVGSATIVDTPDYVVQYSGSTSGEGRVEYVSPTVGSGQLSGVAAGGWTDNVGDSGTFQGNGTSDVAENDGVLIASSVSGSGSSSSGLSGGINLTGLSPGDATAVIDLLNSSAASSWDLDISSTVGSPASTQGVALVDLVPELTELTDLSPTSGAFTSSGGVQFTVQATNRLVPTASRATPVAFVQLFWASGPTFAESIEPASVAEVPMHWNTGQVSANASDLIPAPADATHLLIVADPDNDLEESNEQNNVLALTLVQNGKITGGGTLDPGQRNFGFVINTKLKNGVSSFNGNLQYQDKTLGIRLHSTSLDTLQFASDGSATFSGEARVNGVSGYRFTVVVRDSGEPGRGKDSFEITIEGPTGFSYDSDEVTANDGLLRGGNIQFHFPPGKRQR